jgi:hypothetical protein
MEILMKNSLLGFVISGLLLTLSGTVQAGLINRGNGMIYDNDMNITWLADANYAKTSGHDADGLMTWQQSMDWADNL